MEDYDFQIHLDPKVLPRYISNLSPDESIWASKSKYVNVANEHKDELLLGFDPAWNFARDLQVRTQRIDLLSQAHVFLASIWRYMCVLYGLYGRDDHCWVLQPRVAGKQTLSRITRILHSTSGREGSEGEHERMNDYRPPNHLDTPSEGKCSHERSRDTRRNGKDGARTRKGGCSEISDLSFSSIVGKSWSSSFTRPSAAIEGYWKRYGDRFRGCLKLLRDSGSRGWLQPSHSNQGQVQRRHEAKVWSWMDRFDDMPLDQT